MGNRTSIQRDGGTAEVYGCDLAQQATRGVEGGNAHTYGYDASGNRTSFDAGGSFTTNNLNQQTMFNGQTVTYDNTNGNVSASSVAGTSSYIYDAQNRLTSATSGGTTTTFNYDPLNRKTSQTVGGVTTYNVWDGWNLVEERGSSNALLNTYVYGAGEIVERITGTTPYFYYQDGLGSTSHVSDAAGNLLEGYRYGTFGQISVYAPNGTIRKGGSSYDIRHLFTGQLWMPQSGLYDYRNRAYSPSLTRFLQPDPIGFGGYPGNVYRYCGNNSVNRLDALGLKDREDGNGPPTPDINEFEGVTDGVVVDGGYVDDSYDWGQGSWVNLGPGMPSNFGTFSTFGGTNHFGGGGGTRATRSINSNGVGRVPVRQAPLSTQGFWTGLDGLPTGSA